MNTPVDPNDIPTLTDIVQAGDEAMKNHFDGHFFDAGEQAKASEPSGEAPEELIETIEVLVQEALNETLPDLEERLKGELTRKVLDRLPRG